MSDLPPPTPGQRPRPAPHDSPQTAATSGRTRRMLVIATFLVIVIVGVVVVVLTTTSSTDHDAADTSAPATSAVTTTTSSPTTEAPPTTSPSTDEPTTTAEPTTTTIMATTTTTTPPTSVAVPAGAIDLEHGVYFPVPDGWAQVSAPGEPVVVSDGATRLGIQVLSRPAGEDIAVLVQEYSNTFDSSFTAVGFGPTRYVGTVDAPIAIDEYNSYYTTYEPGDAVGLSGAIDTLVRGDGLSMIVDAFATSDVSFTIPRDAYDAMVASFAAAPPLTSPVAITPRDTFRVTAANPTVDVDGAAFFTVAPGFQTVASGTADAPHAQVVAGAESFSVDRIGGQSDVNTVIAAAQAILGNSIGALEYDAPLEDPADQYGVIHGAFAWRGQAVDGPATGSVNYYFDPASGNAYVAFRVWSTAANPAEPFFPEAEFMLRSLYTSITTIG